MAAAEQFIIARMQHQNENQWQVTREKNTHMEHINKDIWAG